MADTPSPDDTEGENGLNAAHLLLVLGGTRTAEAKYPEAEKAFMEARRMYSRTGNDTYAANALIGLGDVYLAQSKHGEARKAFTEAHEIHSRIGDDMGVANTLILLGAIYLAESKHDEAKKALTEAHEIHSRLGSDLGVANALLGLGDVHRVQLRPREAEKAFKEAHELHSRIGYDLGAANALNALGQVYGRESKHGEAEKAFKEANKIYTRISNDLGAANALNGLGLVYKSQSNYGEAEKAFTEAHEIHSRIGNGQGDAVALDRLGRIYVAQSQYGKAEKAFAEAHKIFSHLGDDLGAADALDGLGQSCGHQLKHREAEQAFIEAHEIYSRLGDDEGAADALTGLGQAERDLLKHGEAEKAFMEAHEIYTRVGNSEGVANALLGLGTIYRAQSRNAEAEKALNDAHKVPGVNEQLHSGNVYRNLGILAQNQYRYNEAEVYYRRALAAYDLAGHVDSKARTLLALGRLQYDQHKYLDAQEAVTEALAIWNSVANEEGRTTAFLFLAQISKSLSKHVDTKDALVQLESELARTDQGIAHAAILLQLGALCMEQAKYDEAEEHYRVAEAIFSSMGNARCEAAALRGLGALYFLQGRDHEAEMCFAQAHIAYPDEADDGGVSKALEEMFEAHPLINKVLDKMEAQASQLINSGKTKGPGMEAFHIYARNELEDTEGQNQDKAREILNQIFRYRMDPASIKMMDTIPRAKGGQGVVLLGILSLSTPFVEMAPMIKEIETALGITPEMNEKWGFDLGLHFNKHNDRMLAKYEALGLPPEALNKMFQEGKKAAKMLERWDKAPNERRSELKVAVKVLGWRQDDLGEATKFFKSFANEVSLMAKLSHPNIVDLLGFVEDVKKGYAWIILAWEENGNVREFLQSGQWDIPERISLIKDTINGLEYLHTQQPPICHGDLKSLNILVSSSYRAVITDFGSARIRQSVASEREETPPSTSTEVVADSSAPAGLTSPQVKFNPSTSNLTLTGPGFSLRWTAPEVLNDGTQDLPSDMWAMGWICWEIVTGKIPFQELNHDGAIIMHTITGKLPVITKDTDLSHVLGLCSLRLEVRNIPSKTPSGDSSDGQKVRSAALLLELGKMHQFQSNNPARAEVHYQEALDIAIRTKNEVVKANALFYLGEVLSLKSKYPEAEQASAEAHQVYSRIGNNVGAANALYDLGKLYLNQEKHLEAEKAFTEAHETFSRIGRGRALADVSSSDSDLGAADTLYHLGHLYRKQEKYREAEDTFEKARETYSRVGHEPGVANALGGLGEFYCTQAKYNEAERVFTASREIYSRTGNDIEMARAQWRLGRVYESQSRIQEAENAFKDAHKLSSAGGDNIMAGHACRSLGNLYSRVRRDLEAEEAFQRALTAYDHTGDPDSRALTLVGLGTLQYHQHRYLEAEEALSEALTIWRSIEKRTEQILPLLILSKIFKLQSRHNEERDTLIQLDDELARRNDGDARRADILTRLGDYYLSEGMYGESEKCYRLAQAVSLSLGDTQQEANALFGLGRSCTCQRRYDEAEECFTGSRTTFTTMAKQEDEAKALECLVEVYILQDRFEEARVACVEACDICTRLGRSMRNICLKTRKPPRNLEEMDSLIQSDAGAARNAENSLRAGVLTRFGYDHLPRGAFKDAEECFRLAQSISSSFEMTHERGIALLGLGLLFLVQKRADEAEPCFVQARVAFASIADEIQEATTLDVLTMLYNEQGKIEDARRTCMEARDIYTRLGQPMSKLCADTWERLQGLGE